MANYKQWKVNDLIKYLKAFKAEVGNTYVYLSKDEEGNGFSTLGEDKEAGGFMSLAVGDAGDIMNNPDQGPETKICVLWPWEELQLKY